jgi:hypothetical protein
MARPFRQFALPLAAAFAVLCSWSIAARAEESSALPRDVSALDASEGKLPPLPKGFERRDEGWLVLEAPVSVRERMNPLVTESENTKNRLSEDLGQRVLDHVLVRVAHTPEEMAELAPEGEPPPLYAAGVAYPAIHVVLLALKEPVSWEAPDLTTLLRHELTHIALADAAAEKHVPRWFSEGLAIRESGELPWARSRTLWDASLSRHLLPLVALDQGFPSDRYDVNIAYAESADFVNFLMRDTDRARFGSLVERVRGGEDFTRALEDAYGTDLRKLEYEWREGVERRFGFVPMLTGGGLLWTVIVALAALAWVKKRREAKAKLLQWAREEARAETALTAAPRAQPGSGEEELPVRPPSLPMVEHEGRWYTVH